METNILDIVNKLFSEDTAFGIKFLEKYDQEPNYNLHQLLDDLRFQLEADSRYNQSSINLLLQELTDKQMQILLNPDKLIELINNKNACEPVSLTSAILLVTTSKLFKPRD
jgi:hypothetical protein